MRRLTPIDPHIGAKIRARRSEVGLTQEQLAALIGVTYQQLHKYETGINRVAASRLYQIAQALGVSDINYFYEGIGQDVATITRRDAEKVLGMSRAYQKLNSKYQGVIHDLVNILIEPEGDIKAA